jgi:hypothetical protein
MDRQSRNSRKCAWLLFHALVFHSGRDGEHASGEHHCSLPSGSTSSAAAERCFRRLTARPGCASVNARLEAAAGGPVPTHYSRPRRLARSYVVLLFHTPLSSDVCRRTPTLLLATLLSAKRLHSFAKRRHHRPIGAQRFRRWCRLCNETRLSDRRRIGYNAALRCSGWLFVRGTSTGSTPLFCCAGRSNDGMSQQETTARKR